MLVVIAGAEHLYERQARLMRRSSVRLHHRGRSGGRGDTEAEQTEAEQDPAAKQRAGEP